MHVLHVTPYYEPAWAFGAAPSVVAALARAQAAHGHEVSVLTTDVVAPHERAPQGESVVDGVRVIRVRNVSGSLRVWLGWSTPIGMRRRARRLFQESAIDVVHLHELVSVEALRVVGVVPHAVPIVASLHRQFEAPAVLALRHLRLWYHAGGRRLLTRIQAVVAPTDDAREQFERQWGRTTGPIQAPVHVIGPEGLEPPSRSADLVSAWDRLYDEAERRLSAGAQR